MKDSRTYLWRGIALVIIAQLLGALLILLAHYPA